MNIEEGIAKLTEILGNPIFENKVKNGYINNANGWGFSENEISNNEGKLLTLDIDFGNSCSLNCPNCFRKDNIVDSSKTCDLSFDNTKNIILQAKRIGLKSVKFLGKGDPLEESLLVPFIQFLKDNEIIPLIFTKGHIIANDDAIKSIHGEHKIQTGVELVKFLKSMDVTILFGYNSMLKEKQNEIVGQKKSGKLDYFNDRNKALQILIDENYNEFISNKTTKLAFAINPVTKDNIDEILHIYKLVRKYNIYPIVTPTMMSGRGEKRWKEDLPEIDSLVELYTNIYRYNIEFGIQKVVDIKTISPYAGGHVCNQTGIGLYITLDGSVLLCPGNNFKAGKIDITTIDQPSDNQIKNIWEESQNYQKRKGKYNCYCIAKDGYSIPLGFYNIVLDQLNNNENSFKKKLNLLEYKIMFDWYKDNVSINEKKKYIGISIQTENEIQQEDSPTRKCSTDSESISKLINNFCYKVQREEKNDSIKLCNKLDYYLKKKLVKMKGTKHTGLLCQCHEGVSNILFKHDYQPENGEKEIELYVFIGHILFTGKAGPSFLKENKIKILEDEDIDLNEKRFLKSHPDLNEENIDDKFIDENISILEGEDLVNLKETVDNSIDIFLRKHNMASSLMYDEYEALKRGITTYNIKEELKLLYRQYELLKGNDEKWEEIKDLFDNLLFYLDHCSDNNRLKIIKKWIGDGLNGKITNDEWFKFGKKIKL